MRSAAAVKPPTSPSDSPTSSGRENDRLLMGGERIAPSPPTRPTVGGVPPPHPWSREDRKLKPLERLLFWPVLVCVCVPLAIFRIILLFWTAVISGVTLALCQGPLECLLEPAMKAIGRVSVKARHPFKAWRCASRLGSAAASPHRLLRP